MLSERPCNPGNECDGHHPAHDSDGPTLHFEAQLLALSVVFQEQRGSYWGSARGEARFHRLYQQSPGLLKRQWFGARVVNYSKSKGLIRVSRNDASASAVTRRLVRVDLRVVMKLILGAVAIALAGNSAPAPLPYKLPSEVGGFAFGDSVNQLRQKCEKLGPMKGKEDRPRFRYIAEHNFAFCEDVKPGKPYLPATAVLTFLIKDNAAMSISAELPIATLMEYARQIARSENAQVDGNHYCKTFPDGVGGVCVDLETKILLLTLR